MRMLTQVWQASQNLQPMFAGIDQLVGRNLRRVQTAMRRHRIGPHHFSGSTGYGHGDLGREAFDEVLYTSSTILILNDMNFIKNVCNCDDKLLKFIKFELKAILCLT